MMGKKTKDRQLGLREIKNLLNHRGDSEIKKKKHSANKKWSFKETQDNGRRVKKIKAHSSTARGLLLARFTKTSHQNPKSLKFHTWFSDIQN